ncbi:MAG: hypothetical protein PHR35_01355 [Kiritimatiellae bacterium]|nr:hypothetical protein [Kiritimatiellia bacterium]
MTLDQVRKTIPEKYFVKQVSAVGHNCLADRAFVTNVLPTTAVVYAYDEEGAVGGGAWADAVLYFDSNGILLGFSYGGSSAPLLDPDDPSGKGATILGGYRALPTEQRRLP